MDSSQAVNIVDFFGQYGVTGLICILGGAVVYLYRQHTALSKEVRGMVEKYAADLALCQKDTLNALNASTEAVRGVQEALKEFKDALK